MLYSALVLQAVPGLLPMKWTHDDYHDHKKALEKLNQQCFESAELKGCRKEKLRLKTTVVVQFKWGTI